MTTSQVLRGIRQSNHSFTEAAILIAIGKKPLNITEIETETEISPITINKRIAALREDGIIVAHRKPRNGNKPGSNWITYGLSDNGQDIVFAMLNPDADKRSQSQALTQS